MADLVNRQHESIVSINDMSMETDTNIYRATPDCHRTDVSTNSSEIDSCHRKNDSERENEDSCSEDVKHSINPVEEFLQERSSNFFSAGQIRARCSSAKNMPNSSEGENLKRLLKAESDELTIDKESFKNSSGKKHSKPSNFLKKSPGLALRLSENPIYNHDVINGNYDDDEEEDNRENIPESEDGCKNFISEPGGVVFTDGLANYESQIKKEREEKLEKIARIDLLYQKQIESEMNAGIEAHLNKKLGAETKVQTNPSSHDEPFDAPSIDQMVKIRTPNLLMDPSLAPKRKIPKASRAVFPRFPGKSVNLPSVEDGLSSGNASGDDNDDNDAGTDASGNDKVLCDPVSLTPLPVESPVRVDEIEDRRESENLADDNLDPNEVDIQSVENVLENLYLKSSDAEVIDDDRSDDRRMPVDGRSTRSNLPIEECTTDVAVNLFRPLDENKGYKDGGDMENIQDIGARDDAVCDCAKEEDSTLENDNSGEDRTSMEVVEIAVAPTLSDVCGEGSSSNLSNRDCQTEDISQDLSASATHSPSEVATFPIAVSSTPELSTVTNSTITASQGTNTCSKAVPDDRLPNHQSDAFEFKSELSSNNKQVCKTEVPPKMPTDFTQKYPKVPLPHIRTGSGCSPPTSLEVAQKFLPLQKVEGEVFELQPILGIPRKVTQVHRSPSPFSGTFRAPTVEKPCSESGWPAPKEDLPSSRPGGSGKDSNSSDDVENAIRDIKSAIMKSKNVKLSLPQQLEEGSADNQTEPVWITRQPQDLGRPYTRGVMTASSTAVKNFQGRLSNTKSALPSEDEAEKLSRQEDNYYITKGVLGFPVHGNNLQQCQGAAISTSSTPLNDKPWASSISIGEQNHGSPQNQNPFRRQFEVTRYPPPSSGYGSMTFQSEAVEHVPYNCNRYDCHECRHLPDNFDDEDDEEDVDDDNEDDEENGDGLHNYEEEEEYDDETMDVVSDYMQMKPELDVASPCRIHGNHHHPLAMGGTIHHCAMEISQQPIGSRLDKADAGGSVDEKHTRGDRPKYPPEHGRCTDANPEYSTDEETDNLLKKQYNQEAHEETLRRRETPPSKQTQFEQKRNKAREVALRDPSNESVLIEGVLFRANYLGSTQLISEGQPSKAMRMMQAQEAVGRIKAPDGESQPSTEVDLFVSVEKIMVLNTNLQEIMMDHALRTISYIADISDILVIMARRGSVVKNSDSAGPRRAQTKICCHVFESEEAQLIAQSIGQAFQVSYVEFLKANGIEETSNVKNMDYQDVLNQQEVYGEELYMLSNKEMQREVIVSKVKGEPIGVVIVESGWGSMIPTVVLANMAPCGAAARCNQLNIGDQIISINGISMVGLPLTTCQSYIKAAKSQSIVKLTVVSCPPVVEVLIKRPDVKYQLGFSVQNGVICSLLRGGIAERGGVRVGHRIIEINGQSVVATHHEKIVNMLATSAGEIHMKTMPTSIFQLLTGQIAPHYI